MSEAQKIELKHVVFVGRTWKDYTQMFNLTEADLAGRNVLDCPGGAASFTRTARERGYEVTACDIAYHFTPEELLRKGLADLETVQQVMSAHPEAAQARQRNPKFASMVPEMTATLHETVADMQKHSGGTRYVPGSLPHLPFADRQFDLTLSGNLLFIYSEQLGLDFHLQAIRELMRVTSREIRLFPLVALDQQVSPFLQAVLDVVEAAGWTHERMPAAYELAEAGAEMLCLRRA